MRLSGVEVVVDKLNFGEVEASEAERGIEEEAVEVAGVLE